VAVPVRLAAASAVLAVVLATQAQPSTVPRALATAVGFARVTHLSPDTAPFDAALTPAGTRAPVVTLRGVAYGDVSAYQRLAPGSYTLTLRGTGTGEQGVVLLSRTVRISSGQAYTLALMGLRTQLSLRVIGDNIQLAGSDKARLRVINAATTLDPAQVTMDPVGQLWPQVGFSTVTPYRDVPAGQHVLRASEPGGGSPIALPVTLAGNSVYTAMILNGSNGARLQLVTDATGPVRAPSGSVETGLGGAAAIPAGWPAAALPAGWPSGGGAFDRLPVPGGPVELAGAAAPGRLVPVELRVPRIGVRARIVGLHLDRSGALVVPSNYDVTGWYGAVPGTPGPAVLAGHVDSRRGPAVFFRLRTLRAGDLVLVRRSDGRTLRYVVASVATYPKARFPADQVYEVRPDSELRLITCGGTFDESRRSYRDNIVVTAVPATR
jgi:hypothetical protein